MPKQERSAHWLWLANLNHTSQGFLTKLNRKNYHFQTCYLQSSGFGFLLLRVHCLAGMLG